MMHWCLLMLCMSVQLMGGESILLKFNSGSQEFTDWKFEKRKGSIAALQPIIGNHDSKPYVRDELINALLQKKGEQTLASSHPLERIAVLNVLTDIPIQKAIRSLAALDFIEYAEVMPRHTLIQTPNDPLYGYQYHQQMIGVDSAWSIMDAQGNGDSVLVGIVDTGVDPLHEDLSGVMFVNPGESGIDSIGANKSANGIDDDNNGFIDDWQGWDFASSIDPVKGDNRAVPGHLHGTHVAGIACAITNNAKGIAGIARNHRILPVKVGYDD
ncbi:MAG: S8 family serine peptidase, partial [Bacteroidota bacterium]